MLWLCIHLPQLSLEVFSRGNATPAPAALSDGRERRPRVLLCNAAATARGIYPGLEVGAAHALVAGLQVYARNIQAEAAALNGVAAWAGQYTPVTSLAPPQALLLEVAGSLNLFGGVEALGQRVEADGLTLGYRFNLAIAPTPLAALWLARHDHRRWITDPGALSGALASLPVYGMDLPAASVTALNGMGVRTIGDCLRLPRSGLARRVQHDLPLILDRALGRVSDPRPTFVPPPVFDRRLSLPDAVIEIEALLFGVQRLVSELSGALRARCAGVQTLELRLLHHRAAVTVVPLRLVQPQRDAKHLMRLLRERLERMSLAAPVEEIGLCAGEFLPLVGTTRDLYPDARTRSGGQDWAVLLERLRARLGEEAVRGLCLVAEHRPEQAWRLSEPGESSPLPAFGPRPLWLLTEAMPLSVMHGRPYLGGVLTLEGEAERIESGWWDGSDIARDYYIAYATNGSCFWVYRDLRDTRGWFLHGVFG